MSFLYISVWVGEKTDAKERLSTNLSMIQMIDGKGQVNLLLNRALDINQDINQKILFFFSPFPAYGMNIMPTTRITIEQ